MWSLLINTCLSHVGCGAVCLKRVLNCWWWWLSPPTVEHSLNHTAPQPTCGDTVIIISTQERVSFGSHSGSVPQWFSVPFVKNSQKTVKIAHVSRIHKAAQTPLSCETSITCAWAVATARCPWSRLTVCVYMDVHVSGSRSLPRAATLSSTNWRCLHLV